MSDPFQHDDPIERRLVIGLAKIGLATRANAWREAGDRGLTPTQGQILALLASADAGLRPSAIAEALGVTAATVSDAVAALGAKGLIRKERAPDDGRAVVVSLTDAGRDEARRAAAWSDFLLAAVNELTPAEQAVFLRGLLKMIRALQERGQIPVQRMCVTCRFFRPHVHAHPTRPHHCAFVDAPFGDRQLRLGCPDHDAAPPADAAGTWEAFLAASVAD